MYSTRNNYSNICKQKSNIYEILCCDSETNSNSDCQLICADAVAFPNGNFFVRLLQCYLCQNSYWVAFRVQSNESTALIIVYPSINMELSWRNYHSSQWALWCTILQACKPCGKVVLAGLAPDACTLPMQHAAINEIDLLPVVRYGNW